MDLGELSAADLPRLGYLIGVGSIIVLSSIVGGYRIATWLRRPPDIGVIAGTVAGVAAFLLWLKVPL